MKTVNQFENSTINQGIWPRISVITPSFNQGKYIEKTIQSVLSQEYPNLEYIIIDGGSTDESLEIIRRYEPWLAYWVSEPDNGQSHAINKGWAHSTGEWLAYLNSDDYLEPGALFTVAKQIHSEQDAGFIYGGCKIVDENGEFIRKYRTWDYDFQELIRCNSSPIPQQATFIKREFLFNAGLLDPTFHMAMDYDLWLRLGLITKGKRIEDTLANWRYHADAKTSKYHLQSRREHLKGYMKLTKSINSLDLSLKRIIRDQIIYTSKYLLVQSWKRGQYLLATKYALQVLAREPRSILKLHHIPSVLFSE